MKSYEIYEISNRANKMTVCGENFTKACKAANIKPNKFKIVSWSWVV